jgi:phosphatidylglycerophosphatase C
MRPVAAFDVDGTLTRRDTVLPFLAEVAGHGAVVRAHVSDRRALWRMLRVGGDARDTAKCALLARVLAGRRHDELQAIGERFADRLLHRGGLRPDVLDHLRRHRANGDDVLLVTASLDVYAAPLARQLGASVVATRLEVGPDGRCTGRLDGANCRGEEKARRVRSLLGDDTRLSAAYGNSADDEALLALADHAVWVGARRQRRR